MNVITDLVEPLQTALRERFPLARVHVRTPEFHPVVGQVLFSLGDKHLVFETPRMSDWRIEPYQFWLHRFSALISEKTGL